MWRRLLNIVSLVAIAIGTGYIVSPRPLSADEAMAKCGNCEGLCCGYNKDGSCWASDVCSPAQPGVD